MMPNGMDDDSDDGLPFVPQQQRSRKMSQKQLPTGAGANAEPEKAAARNVRNNRKSQKMLPDPSQMNDMFDNMSKDLSMNDLVGQPRQQSEMVKPREVQQRDRDNIGNTEVV